MNKRTENNLSLETFSELLDQAILDRLCVQVWLGHGDVLFLGMGEQVMAPPVPILTRTKRMYFEHHDPPYEIQTYLSDWCVKSKSGTITSSHNDPHANKSVNILLGLKAIGWEFVHPNWGLNITFDLDITLSIIPYENFQCNGDAWGLQSSPGLYSIVKLDGGRCRLDETLPPE